MKRRGISLFLTLCMLVSVFTVLPMTASAATSGTCGDNLTWTIDDNGTLTISGMGTMWQRNLDYKAPWYGVKDDVK